MKYPFLEKLQDVVACYIFPQTCLVCGNESRTGRPLCVSCLEKEFFPIAHSASFSDSDPTRCVTCGRPLISAAELCTVCRNIPLLTAIDRIIPLYAYSGCAQELLAVWKTTGVHGLSWPFAYCLSIVLQKSIHVRQMAVIPVPPRPQKIRDNGWDQVEELVMILERYYEIPILRCLKRTTTVQQKKLGRLARSMNLRGGINVIPGSQIPETVIVLDDLMTTGSTLDACAAVLKHNGCKKVYGLTLFFD